MNTAIFILGLAALIYLGWGVLYQFFFAVVGHLWRGVRTQTAVSERTIAVLIPAYKEDAVIIEAAKRTLEQEYPHENYEVYVIADSLQAETLDGLRRLPIHLVEVQFEKSTKSKALNETLRQMSPQAYDAVVILDADNEMAPDFLDRINWMLEQGSLAIQGQRAAKNMDTPMAVLDGASEAINTHILCKGHRTLGLSARLAGSGMAFDYALFREVMPEVDAIGGFDKELELRLTRRSVRIDYDHEAIIYDEKVRRAQHFSRQRSRWIAAQFYYARRFFPDALGRLFTKGQLDYFNKASQMLLPPRLLTPGILLFGTLVWWLIGQQTLAIGWGMALVVNILTFLLAMPRYVWRKPYRSALFRLPLAFFYALRSMLGIGKANKQFIHTPHGK